MSGVWCEFCVRCSRHCKASVLRVLALHHRVIDMEITTYTYDIRQVHDIRYNLTI